MRCAVAYIYIYKCSKYQSIPFKKIWVIVRKQNFNQNSNLYCGRPPAIPTIANLLAEIFRWKIRLKTAENVLYRKVYNLYIIYDIQCTLYLKMNEISELDLKYRNIVHISAITCHIFMSSCLLVDLALIHLLENKS